MDEQLLKDFLETAIQDKYNWEVIMPKFPELEDVDLQVLKDYAETAKVNNYNYDVINPKFPELFKADTEVKKKDEPASTSQEEVMGGGTQVVEEPGSLEPSVQGSDYEYKRGVDAQGLEIGFSDEYINKLENPNQEAELRREALSDYKPGVDAQGIEMGFSESGLDNLIFDDAIKKEQENITQEDDTLLEDFFGKNILTDFWGDMYRAAAQGQAQGGSLDESLELFVKGKDVTDEDIQDFIIAQERMNNAGQSDEMRDFSKIYEEDGGGWWGFIKGVASNPSVIPQLFVSSVSAMVNPTTLAAAGVGAGTGAAIGSTGFSAGPLGVFTTAGGAMVGAMAASGAVLEAGLSFAELLLEQLDGKPMTKENVREILESEEKMQGIRFKSAGRGIAIGVIDGITGGVASKVTAKVAGATGKKLLASAAGGTVEAFGGGVGEVAGRLVAGQEMDVAEIGFESVAGTATTPLTVGYGLYKSPKYYINPDNVGGENKLSKVSGREMAKFIRESTDEEIAGAQLSFKNDPVLEEIAKERKLKIKEGAVINSDLKQAGIDGEENLKTLTALELEKQNLSGNTTEAGKNRLSQIDKEIKELTTAAQAESAEARVKSKILSDNIFNLIVSRDVLKSDEAEAIIKESYPNVEKIRIVDDKLVITYKKSEQRESYTEEVYVSGRPADTAKRGKDAINKSTLEQQAAEAAAVVDSPVVETEKAPVTQAEKDLVEDIKFSEEVLDNQDLTQEDRTAREENLTKLKQELSAVQEAAPAVETAPTEIDIVTKTEQDATQESSTKEVDVQETRLKKRIDRTKADFKAATNIKDKAQAVISFLNNATVSNSDVTQEDMSWYQESKAKLEAEGYVFEGELGRELPVSELYDINNERESDSVPAGVTIIESIVQPKRIVGGKSVGRPVYNVIQGTGTTIERAALAAEVDSLSDSMTIENMKEVAPKLAAAEKALKKYNEANFTSPVQTEINVKQDAIQEPSTKEVDVQESTNDSREVGEGDTEVEPTTKSETKEEGESESDTTQTAEEEVMTPQEEAEAAADLRELIGETEAELDTELDTEVDTEAEVEVEAEVDTPPAVETQEEVIIADNKGNVTIKEGVTNSKVKLKGEQWRGNENLIVTNRETGKDDNYYSSRMFAEENPDTSVQDHENKIVVLAKKASKAISKILPNTKIVVHRSEAAYNKFVAEEGSRGVFDPTTNIIHVNMPKATAKTIAHEVFHAVLYNKFGTDAKIEDVTKRMVAAVKRKVTDKKLKKELKDFSDNYTEFQNEEYLSELVGVLADNYPSLSAKEKNIVRVWLEKIAEIIGIPTEIDTDADVLDLLNTIGKSVKEGKEITATEVKQLDLFEGGEFVDNPSTAFKEHKVGGFDVTYTENEKIAEYVKDGRITEPENLESFRGNKTAITSPDDMVVGEISFEGEKIFKGQGGLFFVTKFGDVWAAGDETTATKLADMINKSVDANGGKGYLTLTKGTDKKLISSAAGVNSSLGIIDVLLNQNILPKSVIRTAVNKVIKNFGGGNINLTGSSKQMISQLRKFFGDKKNATFEARGTVMERVITEIGMDKRLGDLKKKGSKLTKILGGDPDKTLVGGKTTKTANSLVDLVASLAAEDITKGLNTGDIYGVIEVDGKVEYYPGDHPSYPAHIRQVNGNPPVLHLPKDRPAAKNYLMRDSNKIYKTPAVSPTEYGSFYEKADSKVTDTDVITQEDVKILYPKQRQQKVDVTEEQVQEALQTDKTAQRIIAKGIKPKQGENVGIRLNLNVFKNTGVPVQSIHKGTKTDAFKKVDGTSGNFRGEVINYAPAVTLKDVYLNTHQKSIYEVKNKIKNKFPLASVDGKFQDVPFNKQNLKGTELRFNPFDTQLFETMDGKPVRFVEEATVSGTRVFARGKIDYFTEANKPKPYTPEKSTKQRQQLPDGYFVEERGKGQFTLMKENRRAGEMSIAELQSDKPSVSQVYLRPTDKGLGLAPDMYREIAKAMESKGKTLVSSKYTNNASQGVWKRLVKDGDAEVIGSRIDAEGKLRNMYSFIPSKPKQRQQKVVFNVEKQRVYKNDASGVTFLTKGYGGRFINIPRKAITIKDIDGVSQYQKPLVEVTMERDVYNNQDQARSVVDGKEKFVNQLETIRGFKKIRLIKDSPTKTNLQRVTSLAKQSGIKENNFLPGTLSNPQALNTRLKELGYSLKTYGNPSKPYGYGILKPDGKLFTMSKQRQQVSDVLNKDMSAVEIINVARANNFRGPAIKDYLVRVKKMKVKEVDALLKIPLTMFSSIPEAFTNIKEGMNEGIKFYTDILKKTVTWQIKNKATDAQAFDKAVQLLEESKIFQNQADKNRKSLSTLQKEMIVGMQKSLGVRPMKNTNLKLRVLRQSLKDTKRGAKELKSVQSKLRNFIRRSLPKKLYTKGEITTLISDVTNATEANIDNLIQKVIDKITTIQVADLESTIQKLMDDNYEKIESGREKGKKIIVDVNDRLKALKKDMVTDSMVADDVVKRNLELNQEFNEITNKSEQLSEGDLNRLMDLAVLINLNNATLMNNTDVNKVESLNKAAELLTQIVGKGKELFKAQLKKDHQKYLKNKETLYEQVTGEKIDMSDPEQVAKAKKAEAKGKARKNKRESDGLLKKSVRGLQLAMSSFFKGSESLSGLMNIIDRLPGELIGGKVRKMVYGLLNESTRVYKARKKGNKQIIETKLKEIFGKKWKSGISAMRKPIDWSATKDIFIDEKEVNEAELAYDKDPTIKNRLKLKKVIDENTIVMSQDEILYQYQQFQDPANLASFMNESNFLYRGDPKRILESLMEQVDPKNKEVADWMVEEFYPSLYEHYNKTYKAIYRTNLPWNDKYAGRIYREASAPNPLDLLGTDVKSNNQVSAASTKVRRMNDKPIVKMGMMDVMMTYTTDMEWFASHAEAIRDINKMFDDPLIAQAIEQNNGEGTLLLIRDSIQKIARRGINNAARGKFMNAVNNMFIAARLGANPTIFLKQMTSFITYANDIGIVNYMKYAAVNKTQALKVYKEIWNNSVYVQDRASERIQDVLESYTSLGNVEFSTKENYITKLMMSPVKYGDLGAIFLGGSPNYSFYKAEFQKKNPKATEQQAIDYAIRKFENDTKNTQQSSDLQDKDYYQTADPVVRAFNMFLTTPKQYLRKEFGAMRNLYRKLAAWDRKAGQGTVVQNVRQLAMYHFVMPLFFQFVAMGFPDLGDLEDEEKEDLLRAGILGNFNALFIAGDVLTMIADAVQEKPWAGTTKSLAPLNVMSEIANLYTRAEKTKDPVKKAELTQKMILRITEVSLTPTGKNLPLVNIAKYVKNLNELGEGGSEKDFMRLFNYSKYVIDKEGKDKGTKLSKKEMQLYFPDLYEQEMALDKELKELDKELELELEF